ncbi:MAG: hypothetical protein NTV88_02060 [Candidatus Micrarchaeota archaeon]|nr:hypothetical protein [Candidatus Micrarchaeota archaeon]
MNELSFLDIAILRKIDAESSVEKFGSMINTSFFETANLLGTTKIKGYMNKLIAQNFMDYEMKSAKVYFVLTEMGFNATGGVRVQSTLPAPEQKSAEVGAGAQAKLDTNTATPPWVKIADVKKPEHKESHKPDVAHILKDEAAEKHIAEKARKETTEKEKAKAQPKRQPTPEEEEAAKKMKRVASKVEYYLVEYAPYIVMILVLIVIFTAVILFGISKLG